MMYTGFWKMRLRVFIFREKSPVKSSASDKADEVENKDKKQNHKE